jgi:glutamate--cysteine ligase
MAVINTFAHDAADLAEPLTLDAAHALSCEAALAASEIGTVGLEIEAHLVDLRAVSDAVAWPRVEQVIEDVRAAVGGSSVTVEPGGQLELSGRVRPRCGLRGR